MRRKCWAEWQLFLAVWIGAEVEEGWKMFGGGDAVYVWREGERGLAGLAPGWGGPRVEDGEEMVFGVWETDCMEWHRDEKVLGQGGLEVKGGKGERGQGLGAE